MKKTVIIIGGGIAGLSAARELINRGAQVRLLEAGSQLGGRIHTLQTPAGSVELGAEFVHGKSPDLLKSLSSAGLAVSTVSPQFSQYHEGSRFPINYWEEIGHVIKKINPRERDISFGEFLFRGIFSPAARSLAAAFAEGFNAADIDNISAHSLLRANYASGRMDGHWQGRVEGGYSQLVEFIGRDILARGGAIETEAPVRSIKWSPGKIEASVEKNGKRFVVEAEAAIFTIPLGAWKSDPIQFFPSLSDKTQIVREFKWGHVIKHIFVFNDRWWPPLEGGFILALRQLFPTWWEDPHRPILTAWAGGTKADALLDLSPAQHKVLALQGIARLFAARPSFVRGKLVESYSQNWSAEPFIRGAYSYLPVNGLDLPKSLAAPVDETLFLAGEATVGDAQTGTVFGAMESGLRAARQLLQSGADAP